MGEPVSHHTLYIEGPLRHPGGKGGMHQVVCSCGGWTSSPGATPQSRLMWDAGRAHAGAVRARERAAFEALLDLEGDEE